MVHCPLACGIRDSVGISSVAHLSPVPRAVHLANATVFFNLYQSLSVRGNEKIGQLLVSQSSIPMAPRGLALSSSELENARASASLRASCLTPALTPTGGGLGALSRKSTTHTRARDIVPHLPNLPGCLLNLFKHCCLSHQAPTSCKTGKPSYLTRPATKAMGDGPLRGPGFKPEIRDSFHGPCHTTPTKQKAASIKNYERAPALRMDL